MKIDRLAIEDVCVLTPPRFVDERGFLSEVFNRAALAELDITCDFVQDNHSLSRDRGTVRGLHFQAAPHAQSKLVRVPRGAIFDVAVDLRAGSATFARHVSAVISAEAWNQMFIPAGFAHGFCTLEPDTEVLYKMSAHYAPESELGLLWCDPELAIDWPVTPGDVVVSERDRTNPTLRELQALAR